MKPGINGWVNKHIIIRGMDDHPVDRRNNHNREGKKNKDRKSAVRSLADKFSDLTICILNDLHHK